MQLQLATGAFSRQYGTPFSQLINMMAESSPVVRSPKIEGYQAIGLETDIRLPRPGLISALTLGSGPNRALFFNKGLFNGKLLQVSGTEAYLSDGTDLGVIPGTDLVRIDNSPTQVVAVAQGKAYLSSSGSAFAQITDSDLPPPVDVTYFGGYFVYPIQNSTMFYYSEVNDAGNIDGLNFESVETTGDPIVGTAVLVDEIVFFKTTTIEFWGLSGNADNPFQESPGVRYMRGCASRDTICQLDNALFWLGEDRVVYRTSQVPTRISDHGIEDKLRQCANSALCTAWTCTFEGHDFYVLNIAGIGTFVYDVAANDWAEWKSYGRTGFRGRASAAIDGTVYVGDDTSNVIWTLAQGVNFDGADPLVRQISAFTAVGSGRPRCNNLMITCARGVGNAVAPGNSPIVEMRYSDDGGRTFCDWRQASLGAQGDYSVKAIWQRLGLMTSPGRLFEFRCADPVMAVFQSLLMNEDRP